MGQVLDEWLEHKECDTNVLMCRGEMSCICIRKYSEH